MAGRIARLGVVVVVLGALAGAGYLFVTSVSGQALVNRVRHFGWKDARATAGQLDGQVHADVAYFLNTPTPQPTAPPPPTPTLWPTMTPFPTPAPTSPPTAAPTPPESSSASVAPDVAGQVLEDYLASLSNGNRVAALDDWTSAAAATGQSLVDAALKRGEHDQVTNLQIQTFPGDPTLCQVEATTNVTVGRVTTRGVQVIYQLRQSNGAWKITARLQ